MTGPRLLRILTLFLISACAAAPSSPAEIFSEIDRNLKELARITGLRAPRRVPHAIITREKVNEFLNRRVQEVASPEEIRAQEVALKKLGLVPRDFNLAKSTVDLYTEQAIAFYDFQKRRLFLTDWVESETRDIALVHELAHALADHNFRLDRYLKDAKDDDDASLARMAVMEGQASWLMAELMAQKTGQSLRGAGPLVAAMARMATPAAGEFPVFEQAPLYMRETLVFPYTSGMLFQHALVEKHGDRGFAEPFRRAPLSTQQILHPETYLAGAAPVPVTLPSFSAKGYRRLIEGTTGELDHSILLTLHAGKEAAARIAPHWRGGRYAVHEHRASGRALLAYASAWETPEAAREYFKHYSTVLRKKSRSMNVVSESDDRISGNADDGEFVVKLEGRLLTSLEGLPVH